MRETIGMLRRTLARLDVSSRSIFALIEPGSCFAGTLLELALAADRSYMLAASADALPPTVALSAHALDAYPTVNGRTRLAVRFGDDPAALARCREAAGRALSAGEALDLGLVTFAPDDLDWDDEVRIALEERASLSPDALTGMEANLRFPGAETMAVAHLRAAVGVAELDLHPAQRRRRARRAQGVRHRAQGGLQPGPRVTSPTETP